MIGSLSYQIPVRQRRDELHRTQQVGALLAKIDSTGTKYYHQDHLSNRIVTNSTGGVAAEMGHFPFGESWYNATNDKLLFTTYERDAESGNDYAMARYHISRLGRLSSPDPIAGSAVNPQSLNRYSYSINDPANVTDPSGALPNCNTAETNPKDKSQQASGDGPSDTGDEGADAAMQSGCPGSHTNPFGGAGNFFSDWNAALGVDGAGGFDGGFVRDDSGMLPSGEFQAGGGAIPIWQLIGSFFVSIKPFNFGLPDGYIGEADIYGLSFIGGNIPGSLVPNDSGGSSDDSLGKLLGSHTVLKKPCAVSAQSLDAYLQSKGSPMTGQGANLMNAGSAYNVDPRFVVALAGAESGFGTNITSGQYNAWNWFYNGAGNPAPFSSWGAGITSVSKGLGGRNYLGGNPPLTTTSSIYGRYCNGPDCVNGLNNINTFLTKQGGDPNALTFPCK